MRKLQVLCALLLCNIGAVILAQDSSFVPLGWGENKGNRFDVEFTADYSNEQLKLRGAALSVYDTSNELVSEEISSADRINDINASSTSYAMDTHFGIKFGFRVWNNLRIYAGIGLSQVTFIKNIDSEKEWEGTTNRLVPVYELGLGYAHYLYKGLYVECKPTVRYLYSDYLTHVYNTTDYPTIGVNINPQVEKLKWEVPIEFKYKLGNFIPSVGLLYMDSYTDVVLSTEKQYIGELYNVQASEEFRMNNKIRGLVSCEYLLGNNFAFGIKGAISNSYSVAVKMKVSF